MSGARRLVGAAAVLVGCGGSATLAPDPSLPVAAQRTEIDGPSRADAVALAVRIDALCPDRALPRMVEGDAIADACPQEVLGLEVALEQALDHFLLLDESEAFDDRLGDDGCQGPTALRQAIAVEAANRIRETIDRDCGPEHGSRPCTARQRAFRQAVVRHELARAADMAWADEDHELSTSGLFEGGLERDMALLLDLSAVSHYERDEFPECRVVGTSAWDQPERWVELRILGTVATLRAPRSLFRPTRGAVDGVELTAMSLRGDPAPAIEGLASLQLAEQPWPAPLAPPGSVRLFVGRRHVAVLATGSTEQLVLLAGLVDPRREAAVVRSLASVTRPVDGAMFVEAPLVVEDPELVWMSHDTHTSHGWRWTHQIDAPLGYRLALAAFFTADPMHCEPAPIFPIVEGGLALACDDPPNDSPRGAQLIRSVPLEGGILNVVAVVPAHAALPPEAAAARAREIFSHARITSAAARGE